MNLSNTKVSTRLSTGFGVLIVLMIAMALMSLRNMSEIKGDVDEIVNENIYKMDLLQNMSESVHIVSRVSRTLLLLQDKGLMDNEFKKIEAARGNYDAAWQSMEKTSASETGTALRAKIKAALEVSRPLNSKVIELAKANQATEALELLMNQAAPATQKWQEALDEYIALQKAHSKVSEQNAQKHYDAAIKVMLIFSVLALLVGMAAAWLITRSLTRQLGGEPSYAADIAAAIAQGDLTVDIATRSNDKSSLLFAMKTMRDGLVNIVSQVRTSTDTIATASSQIASGNLDLSSRTEEQASSLEETASSMEELTSTVKQNADNAKQANQLAATASDIAVKGGEVVSEVVHTMEAINESSKKIVDIISVIDGIAFQTNILALNAAVEAARAGEQGRGFAVVASEVRSLAQRSASAAKEIKELIGNSVEKVEAGSALVGEAGSTISQVVESVKRVTDIMSEITAASQEQASGIEQVNQAVAQMDEVTQQNAALVEEAAAASQSMQDEAANLANIVSVFKLSGMQAQAPKAAAKPRPTAVRAQVAHPAKATTAVKVAAPSAKPKAISAAGNNEEWEEF